MMDIVEQIRERNQIEDVIAEDGFLLHGHGRYRRGRGRDYDSLVVDVRKQMFVWNSRAADGWQGDVFTWVMKKKGADFRGAVEILAARAGMPPPVWGAVNEEEIKTRRTAATVFSVAAEVFHRWLMGDEEKGITPDQDALDYARGRGWSDETLNEASIGFSGRKQAWQVEDMLGDFSLHGIDPECPHAVAVTGFSGDVAAWIKRWPEIDPGAAQDWIERGRIHGLMDTPGLIYVHVHNGQTQYLTRRQLPGFDVIRDYGTGKERPWKSFNPQTALVGGRRPYFNHVYRRDADECVIVEGQGDAVTLGQWGVAALALCGVQAADDAMGWLTGYLKKHRTLYLALDADSAGEKNMGELAQKFGPMARVVEWEWTEADNDESETDNG